MTARLRRIINSTQCVVALCLAMTLSSPLAHADDRVTYEVISDEIHLANLEYQDSGGRVSRDGVTLPWREDVTVRSLRAAPPDGSQVRADWRPSARPARWVTVRISYHGAVICQNTLDVGDAACYGITPRIT
jgi:hypothetical protein